MVISGTHDSNLVLLSIAIAVFASFTGLSLASRIRASQGWMQAVWLAAAAVALGGGIWAMHFVAMLAFSMPGMRMSYDLGLTLVSLGIALVFTGLGFAAMRWKASIAVRVAVSGLLMGSGVVAMHYSGMAAMKMDACLSYDRFWLSASVLIAIGAASAAVWLASLDHKLTHRLAAAMAMGGAIAGMHYAGMKAAVFSATSHVDMAQGTASVSQMHLALGISVITVLILAIALGAARLESWFQAYEQREEARAKQLRISEQARLEADALYRAYFENTPDPLFVIGVVQEGAFVVEEINPAHEASLGFPRDQVRGKRVEEILPAHLQEQVLSAYRHVVETGEIYGFRDVYELAGGPQYWDTTLVPVRDASGRVARLIGTSRNVTQQIIAEEALRQSQKLEAMGSLTGGVAHDFNNLLTPILGSLDMLQRREARDEREQRLIAGAVQSAEKAKTLVQRLLAFARRQPLRLVPVNIGKLVHGMADLLASTIGPQIKLVVDTPESLPSAMADPNQLEMALLNLVVNARDAMHEGGTLTISLSEQTADAGLPSNLTPGAYVCLSVCDTGIGMDEATLNRAAEPFFSTKGVGKGTGLGLSMVHGLAAQLGGVLKLSSEPNVGTRVQLWLPQTENEPLHETPAAQGLSEQRDGKILLVDDEDLVRASTREMLKDLGYEVEEASSAEEALAKVDQGLAYDLLITDHLMPGMTGAELGAELLARRPEAPVLVISGYAQTDAAASSLPRLAKPFRQSDLEAKLRELQLG